MPARSRTPASVSSHFGNFDRENTDVCRRWTGTSEAASRRQDEILHKRTRMRDFFMNINLET